MRVLLACVGLIPLLCAAFLVLIGCTLWTAFRGPWWQQAIEGVLLYGVLLLGLYVLCAGAYLAFAHVTYSAWLRGTSLTVLIGFRKEQVDLSTATVRYDDRSSVLTAIDPLSDAELTLKVDAFGDAMLPAHQLTALADAISARRQEDDTQQDASVAVRRLRRLATMTDPASRASP